MFKQIISFSFVLFILSMFISNYSIGQTTSSRIDPKWKQYYEIHPSDIREKYSGIDFINIMKLVGFVPVRSEWKGDTDFFETLLLRFEEKDLEDMMIYGIVYATTYKHDDYFVLNDYP